MPFYELTLITRFVIKGRSRAVIEKAESLGHRDLAYRRIAKQTNEKVYTSNMFLFWTHMSREMRESVDSILRQDLDTVHVGIVTNEEKEPIECNLEEL
ncbi:unnamed protein product, partial [Mesorhabditis belari]|uniref:Uncharacterized protein n=1 Tax=Mesorhabditis belari TaxID=2138241 RepID=A0AAF3F4T3_9BILA